MTKKLGNPRIKRARAAKSRAEIPGCPGCGERDAALADHRRRARDMAHKILCLHRANHGLLAELGVLYRSQADHFIGRIHDAAERARKREARRRSAITWAAVGIALLLVTVLIAVSP